MANRATAGSAPSSATFNVMGTPSASMRSSTQTSPDEGGVQPGGTDSEKISVAAQLAGSVTVSSGCQSNAARPLSPLETTAASPGFAVGGRSHSKDSSAPAGPVTDKLISRLIDAPLSSLVMRTRRDAVGDTSSSLSSSPPRTSQAMRPPMRSTAITSAAIAAGFLYHGTGSSGTSSIGTSSTGGSVGGMPRPCRARLRA